MKPLGATGKYTASLTDGVDTLDAILSTDVSVTGGGQGDGEAEASCWVRGSPLSHFACSKKKKLTPPLSPRSPSSL